MKQMVSFYLKKNQFNKHTNSGKKSDLTNKRSNVVGFGKAVLGMAVQLEKQLGEHLSSGKHGIFWHLKILTNHFFLSGLLSIPTQTVNKGAPNNQPDEVVQKAALDIKRLAASRTDYI